MDSLRANHGVLSPSAIVRVLSTMPVSESE